MIIRCKHCGKHISTVIEYKKKKDTLLNKHGWRLDGPTCFDCLKEKDRERTKRLIEERKEFY